METVILTKDIVHKVQQTWLDYMINQHPDDIPLINADELWVFDNLMFCITMNLHHDPTTAVDVNIHRHGIWMGGITIEREADYSLDDGWVRDFFHNLVDWSDTSFRNQTYSFLGKDMKSQEIFDKFLVMQEVLML